MQRTTEDTKNEQEKGMNEQPFEFTESRINGGKKSKLQTTIKAVGHFLKKVTTMLQWSGIPGCLHCYVVARVF